MVRDRIAVILGRVHASAKEEPAWPPLAMFKALLLSVWYNLSDVKLAEALDDRTSFRSFCGFSRTETTPERTAFVRFRKALIAHKLDRLLFTTVTAQLQSKAVTVKTGTLVDATIIASASEGDDDARWAEQPKVPAIRRIVGKAAEGKHKPVLSFAEGGKPAVHGFKGSPERLQRSRRAHVGADADTTLVEEIAITTANINDGRAGPDALPDDPGEVFADSAYRGSHFRDGDDATMPGAWSGGRARAKGGVPRIPRVWLCQPEDRLATGMWGRDEQETLRKLKDWNQPIHRVRGRIEKIFGTWKRSYGLRRMRWRGIAKAAVQIHLTAPGLRKRA
jgi:transposase, IS5 family